MVKTSILQLIKERLVIFDGAMGTQLIERGLQKGECPELWNIERPDDVRAIHKSYCDAGADVVVTNTFGANRPKLGSYGLQDRILELNLKACELIRSVCPENCYIAGDIGPTGKFLPPVGDASVEEFYSAFLEQSNILKDSGVDLLIIETQYDLREALSALKAAKTTGLPVFVTMTFELKKRGFFTIMGDEAGKSMKILEENGADVVGANCTLDSAGFIELTKVLRASTKIPILVQPNAGQPEMIDGKPIYRETPASFAKNVKLILEAGAGLVGSCCGTTPEFTRELRKLVK